MDTLADAPQSALSGVARVLVHAGKLNAKIAELAKQYQVHPVQISQWKKQPLDGIETLFQAGAASAQALLIGPIFKLARRLLYPFA